MLNTFALNNHNSKSTPFKNKHVSSVSSLGSEIFSEEIPR